MGNGSCNAKLQTLFFTLDTGKKAPFPIIAERAAEGIPHVITESCNAIQLGRMRLDSQFLQRISTATCTPSLTIDIDGGIYFVDFGTDFIHGFDVMNTH